jgi:hypothetical protein
MRSCSIGWLFDVSIEHDQAVLWIKTTDNKILKLTDSYQPSYYCSVVKTWLDKCDQMKKLDDYDNFISRIDQSIEYSKDKQILPMSAQTLKTKNKQLYDMVT